MCFAALDLLIKSCLLKYYYDILAKTCHFLTGLDFTAAWPFNFNSSDCGKGYQCIEENKQTNKNLYCLGQIQHSQTEDTAVEHFFLIPGSSFTVVAMVQWKCGLCVASSLACYYVFIMLFIKRTNWPYGLSVFICINSLLLIFSMSVYLPFS